MDQILTQALAAATISKVLVDMLRQAVKTLPPWASPVLALFFGILAALLLDLAAGATLSVAIVSRDVLAGVLAAGSAVGVTELQKRGQ